jgi:hypothetical protein
MLVITSSSTLIWERNAWMGEAPAASEVPSGEGLQDDAARMKQIAADAVDPTHLLEGENPDSLQPHDAEHWVRVYSELLAFKRGLLSSARDLACATREPARHAISGSDLPLLDAQARKLAGRLEFWRHRLENPRQRT